MSNFFPYNPIPPLSQPERQGETFRHDARSYAVSEARPSRSLFDLANENIALAAAASVHERTQFGYGVHNVHVPPMSRQYEPLAAQYVYTPERPHPHRSALEARTNNLRDADASPPATHIVTTPQPVAAGPLPDIEPVDVPNKRRAPGDATDTTSNPRKRARGKAAVVRKDGDEKENAAVPPSKPKSAAAKKAEGFTDGVTDATRWSVEERETLFNYILGPESDKIFERHRKNPKSVYQKAVSLFDSKFNEASIKGQWTRSLKTFNWILAFEQFTGNGGGDGDADDEDDLLAQNTAKLEKARAAGISLGSLSAKTVDEWQTMGWYDLFASRFKSNPAISTDAIRHSGMTVSDTDDDPGTSSDTVTSNNPPSSTQKTSKTHAAARGFREAASSSLNTVSALLTDKRESEGRKVAVFEKRLELEVKREEREAALEVKREEREAAKHKVEIATKVLELQNVEPDVRDAANKFLKSLFSI